MKNQYAQMMGYLTNHPEAYDRKKREAVKSMCGHLMGQLGRGHKKTLTPEERDRRRRWCSFMVRQRFGKLAKGEEWNG